MEAVQSAMAFAKETLGAERTGGLRLEEVESGSASGEDAWLITLSMLSLFEAPQIFSQGPRDYKIFTVLKSTGEVTSMKIRELVANNA